MAVKSPPPLKGEMHPPHVPSRPVSESINPIRVSVSVVFFSRVKRGRLQVPEAGNRWLLAFCQNEVNLLSPTFLLADREHKNFCTCCYPPVCNKSTVLVFIEELNHFLASEAVVHGKCFISEVILLMAFFFNVNLFLL